MVSEVKIDIQRIIMKLFVLVVAVAAVAFAAPSDPGSTKDYGLKIVGGNDARRGQFPHQISMQLCLLGRFCDHICGGTIVSPTTVITAAHCIISSPIYTTKVVAGILNLDDQNDEIQTVTVANSVIHPKYDVNSDDVQPHDIAILFLSKALTFTSQVQPAKLPFQGFYPSGTAILSGWGSIVPDIRNPVVPNGLQTVTMPVISDINTCITAIKAAHGRDIIIPMDTDGGNVCTDPGKGISACVGDSGGPLINNEGVLIGVVSWGLTPCGNVGGPNVFVNVGHYIDWLLQYINDI